MCFVFGAPVPRFETPDPAASGAGADVRRARRRRSHEAPDGDGGDAPAFLAGQNLPAAKDKWREAAEELGAHVRPIIEFLRGQEEPKA